MMRTKEKPWSYEDYLKLEDDKRYEIIEGELLMSPAPVPYHQAVSRNIGFALWSYVKKKKLGVVYYAPIDVVLDEHNVLQPDIVFIFEERKHIVGEKAIKGAPDLVIEIVSPSSLGRDTVLKRNVYEKSGVKEFWIVYPEMKCVEVLVLNEEEKYELYDEGCLVEGKREVSSKIIKGFKLNLEEVFQT